MKATNIVCCGLVSMWALLLAGCNGGKKQVPFESVGEMGGGAVADSTIYGLCGEGSAMNTLQVIADDGDTLNLSVADAKDNGKVLGGYACGDRMAVIADATKTEARLVINETTLLGDWMMPNPLDGSSYVGISIREGGIVEGIDQNSLVYKSWRIQNGRLELTAVREGGGDEEETSLFDIVKLDADSLVFANADDRFEYGRTRKSR